MTRKIAIVGSHNFPLDAVTGAEIVDCMREYGPDTLFLTRGAQSVDRFVATVAVAIGVRCFVYPGRGGGDNFARDSELAADCDELVAFVSPEALADTKSGTARLMEKVLNLGKPVRAATVAAGTLVWAA